MEKERSLTWWKDAVRNGLKFQEKYADSKSWPQYKSYYRHNFTAGIIPVNLVFSILRSLVPQVYFKNPKAVVTATRPGLEFELHARLVEDLDNWLIKEASVKNQMKRMITDAFLCGTGNGFSGYDSQYGFDQSKTIGDSASATLTQYDNKGYKIEYNSFITPGMPWFLRARPEDTVYPWGCESALNAPWVAMRLFRPLEDCKLDPKYKNTKDLHGSFTQRRTQADGVDNEDDRSRFKDLEWVELWQVHCAKTGALYVFTMDHDQFLRGGEGKAEVRDPSQILGLPVEPLVFNPDPDYIYGIPDTKIIEPQLLELNEIRTQAMKHRRIDVLKLLYKEGAIDPEELVKILSGDVQAAVKVNMEGNIRDSVMPFNPGASGILADLAQAAELVRSDVRETVGFSRSSTGEYQGKTHITKAETDIVNWANQIRVDERRDIVSDLLTNIIKRFNASMFSYWDKPIVRSITGPDGAKWWIKFTGDQIKGEYTYDVDPSNAVPVDNRTKRQDAVEMARTWAEMNQGRVKQGEPVPAEIQRYFFSQYEGINIDRLIAQQGPQAGPGRNPNQAVPPEVAATMMARNNNENQGGGNMSQSRLL